MKTVVLAASLLLSVLQGGPAKPPELGEPIRGGVRWLRAQQDPATGSYGGVAATAWALSAFVECPDAYRVEDGPFVRRAVEFLASKQGSDGAIADAGADANAKKEQTRLAARALAEVASGGGAEPLKRALAFLGEDGLKGPGWDAEPEPADVAAATALAQPLLAKQKPDGSFGDPLATAQAIVELARAERVLARARPKPPPPQIASLPTFSPAERAAAQQAMQRGALFLAGCADDKGRFGAPGQPDPGITAMALSALAGMPKPRPDKVQAVIDGGLAWLATLQHEDGSVHDGKLASYTTSATIQAWVRTDKQAHAERIAKAQKFLKNLQLDEGEGYSEGDIYYGGIGYGSSERPDLSNLQMALEALSASGLEKGDPAYSKALQFLQRCQNRSESNDVRIVNGDIVIKSGDDGGAGYLPGDSKAGFVELADGTKVPRSYGSMTYALLKCFVFAGLTKEDPRMAAAWDWCTKNYTLDVNPGFVTSKDPSAAYQGLFYYFYTLARALDVFGAETVVDGEGHEHAWRTELAGRLVSMQSKEDGSWTNKNSPRWWEGNPVLGTAYALLTLDAAMPR